MTFRYAMLAVGRIERYRGVAEAIPLTEDGNELPPMSPEQFMLRTWTKKVKSYEIKDGIMYCRLEGVK